MRKTPTACADCARPQPSLPIVSSAIVGPSTPTAPAKSALKTSAQLEAGITQPSSRAKDHPARRSPMTLSCLAGRSPGGNRISVRKPAATKNVAASIASA